MTNGSCRISDTLYISVKELKIPNGFSPNGDNVNDLFVVLGIENHPNSELTVFNSWGGIVYQSDNYTNGWDGFTNGNPLPEDTYYYILKISGKVYKGIVVIKR